MAARTDYACTKWVGSRRCGRDGKWDGKRMRCDRHRAPTLGRATRTKREQRRRYRDAIRGLPIPPPPVPKGTSHRRRRREWGRMAYAHTLGCDVWFAYAEEFGAVGAAHAGIGPCRGRREYMHLHLEEGSGVRAPDHQGAIGCEGHHEDIDGEVGGKGPWYVALGRDGQLRLKRRLVDRQRARWDALAPEERAHWDEVGEARFRRPRPGRA